MNLKTVYRDQDQCISLVYSIICWQLYSSYVRLHKKVKVKKLNNGRLRIETGSQGNKDILSRFFATWRFF